MASKNARKKGGDVKSGKRTWLEIRIAILEEAL